MAFGSLSTVQSPAILKQEDGADKVAYKQTETNAVKRNVSDKIKEILSAKDFGVVGDGVTDDTTNLQNAINSSANRVLVIPDGTYLITSNITLPDNVHLKAENDVTIDGSDETLRILVASDCDNLHIDGIKIVNMERAIAQTNANLIQNVTIENCIIDSCKNGIHLVCAGKNIRILNNVITNIINDTECSAIQVGKDSDEVEQVDVWIENNTIDYVENTSATPRDVHGILSRGFGIHINRNNVRDIIQPNASGSGCEGIYLVGHYSEITGNTLYNAGDDEAAILLKGGRDDLIIPQGSFGYNNIISHNKIYSGRTDSSGIETQADDTLIEHNIIEGLDGTGNGITVTANSNRTIVRNNYLTHLKCTNAINCVDSQPTIIGNIIDTPESTEGTFTAIRINSNTEEITRADITDNKIYIDDNLDSTVFYGIYFEGHINAISRVKCVNELINDVTGGTAVYGIGYDGDASVTTSDDFILGGRFRGSFSDVIRFLDAYRPTNIKYQFDLGEVARTANGSVSIFDHESGRIITNDGASGTIIALLPPAEINMEYTFIRTDAQTFRVDPDGTETIRGGGAGKFISLDTDGASVKLVCVENGQWEIVGSNGTLSYQA